MPVRFGLYPLWHIPGEFTLLPGQISAPAFTLDWGRVEGLYSTEIEAVLRLFFRPENGVQNRSSIMDLL
jgi:hypothetical protein